MSSVFPITPSMVEARHKSNIPDIVVETFNRLILQKWDSTKKVSYVSKFAVLDALLQRGYTKALVEMESWLLVSPVFLAAGWVVEYPSEGANVTTDFIFKKLSM